MTTAKEIQKDFIIAFINAVIETFKLQCDFLPIAGKPFDKGLGSSSIIMDIGAVTELTCPVFDGAVAICFPNAVFLSVMERFFEEKFTTITQELEDGASELLNIIFGKAKRFLNDKEYAIEKAIPKVLKGQSLQNAFAAASVILIPFMSDLGVFYIQIISDNE